MTKLKLSRFDLGVFPNKDFEDVPEGGCMDGTKHVLWRRSALRPFPGMELVNSTQAAHVSGQGLHYMDVQGVQKRVAVFGDKFFEDVSGVWTDRTGSVSITVGNRVQFIDHQQGANRYLIGSTGGAPFKWTGTGNAASLGGSPPSFTVGAKYHDTIFGAVNELVYFSDTGDPETWDTTNWVIPYEKNVSCLAEHGPKLAVLMDDHIGSVQGYDYLDFFAEEKEIRTFGCVGKLAAKNCLWGGNDLKVIATIAKDGLWVFDEAFNPKKVFGDNFFDEFNQSNLSKSSLAYWRDEHLLFSAMPYGSSTEPDYLVITNTQTGAFWQGPDIHANYIRAMSSMRDANGNEFIYFIDSNGYAFKFDMDTASYHTGTESQTIDYKWKSKRYDLEDVHSLGELVMLADALGDWGVRVAIKFGLGIGDGDPGGISFLNSEDVLGSTFILGASTLGGSDYVFRPLVGVAGFGRHIQVTLTPEGTESSDLLGSTFILGVSTLGSSSSFRVRFMELHLHHHRGGGDDL